jgi:hypothetical protein
MDSSLNIDDLYIQLQILQEKEKIRKLKHIEACRKYRQSERGKLIYKEIDRKKYLKRKALKQTSETTEPTS